MSEESEKKRTRAERAPRRVAPSRLAIEGERIPSGRLCQNCVGTIVNQRQDGVPMKPIQVASFVRCMSIVSLQTPIREGLEIPRANAHPGSNPGSGTTRVQWPNKEGGDWWPVPRRREWATLQRDPQT